MDGTTRSRLVGLFVTEAEEVLATLTDRASRLGLAPGASDLSDFGRAAHGLKGAAAALGYEDLATMLHTLEDVALGLAGAARDEAADRTRRIGHALEILTVGVERMSASGQDGFPEDLLPALRNVLGSETAAGRAAAGPGPSAPGHAPDARVERISVPAPEVDEALRLASSLARSAALIQENVAGVDAALADSLHALTYRAQSLETIVASLRLLPAEAALSGLDGEVAQLAEQLEKRIALTVSGRDVRADRRTLQAARGMIRHLVRNAVDHGIEKPERRAAAGKPETGRLSVSLRAAESALSVDVEDDGAGFDVPAIREALERRSLEPERITALTEEEVLQRFAAEGGSTRARADEISGRGIGLSAVASMTRAAGGAIRIRSAKGRGSMVGFTLPLEVYALDVLAVHAGGRLLGIPLAALERTVHLEAAAGAVQDGPAGRTVAIGETILPLARLADVLGGSAANAQGTDRFAVIVRAEGGTAALAVESVGAVIGVVPTAVPGVWQGEQLVSGLARLVDGSVLQVLNARVLLASARNVRARTAPRPDPAVKKRGPLELVLAEDSLSTREVLRVLLEEQGFRVRLAADGEEALARIEERLPDVLVTDVNMPRSDGLALTRELRRRAATARLPIVLLTSRDDDDSRAAGAAAGADAYLVKSRFDADALFDVLARIGLRAPG